MAGTIKDSIKTRQIAILVADGFNEVQLTSMKKALEAAGAQAKLIAPRMGAIKSNKNKTMEADQSLLIAASVLFDAVYIPGGAQSVAALKTFPDARAFIKEAYMHCKAIAAEGEGTELVEAALGGDKLPQDAGLLYGRDDKTDKTAKDFIKAIALHRFWEREQAIKKL